MTYPTSSPPASRFWGITEGRIFQIRSDDNTNNLQDLRSLVAQYCTLDKTLTLVHHLSRMEEFLESIKSETKDLFRSKKNLINLLVLVILILALPLSVNLVRQQQIIKSQAAVDPIVFTGSNVEQRDGKWVALKPQISLELTSPLKPASQPTGTPSPTPPSTPPASFSFNVSVDVTGITHYGYNDLLPYAPDSHATSDLAEIQRMRGRVIRIFVANNRISDDEAARRLDVFLTRAASYNISVIASLINFYDSGFGPQGVSYSRCDFSPCLLGEDFFNGGFRTRYKPFVETVVNRNKNHANIYAWEIGNELKYEHNKPLFIDFMNEISSLIKDLDPSHPISTGMLSAAHTGLSPSDLYPNLPNIDIINVNTYNANHQGADDAAWARSNGKRIVVGEIAFGRTDDRSGDMRSEIDYWRDQGAQVILQWGFIAGGLGDNGNGDRIYGMDAIWHSDYDQLAALFSSYNQ